MGKFIRVIPLVVIPILIISLVESLLILPAHLSFGRPVKTANGTAGFVTRLRERFALKLERFVAGPYRKVLSVCIDNKYTTLASAIAILLILAGIVGGGIIKFRFMPEVDSDLITSTLKMPIGTPVAETAKAQDILVRKAQEVIADYDKDRQEESSVIRHIYSTVGSTLFASPMGSSGSSGAHLTNVALLLTQAEKRGVASTEIAKKWRESIGVVPGADSITFVSSLVGFGKNIDIRLAHDDFDILAQAVTKIKQSLKSYPGVSDIEDSYTQGKRELKIRLKPEARTLGITEEDLGRQIRAAFYGAEALRLQRGRNEVKVMVRYPEQDRKSLGNLESMRIRTNEGSEVPFSRAAYVAEGRGFSEINRTDRKRVINVTASVDSSVANAEEINVDLKNTVLNDLINDYPGLTYNLEGEEKERMESMASMGKGFAMALLIIYALLAIPFRSYMQPFIIMSAIPFGFVGAVMGHLIMGFNLSILSMFGVVALTGVVVNDSLLLVNFVNEKRRAGVDLVQAVVEAAQRRFRPIVLTSLTTSLGLTPIILEKSMQAQFLIPMAISLGFGILFATFITLLLVPSLYLILEDLLRPFNRGSEVN
jgi:multidrug efflux pump subunit AcrB